MGLDFGSIIDWKYVRIHTSAPAVANRFHRLVRMRMASPIEAIALSHARTASMADLSGAMAAGRKVLEAVPEVSGEFLLKGVTGIARRDWGAALANLWIVIEQVTSNLWKGQVVGPAKALDPIPGRAEQPNRHQNLERSFTPRATAPNRSTTSRDTRQALNGAQGT